MSHGYVYEIEIHHDGLNKYRHIRGRDKHVVEKKAHVQLASWDAQWQKRQELDAKRIAREEAAREREAKKTLALERTDEAEESIRQLEQVLGHTLNINDAIRWDDLKSNDSYALTEPAAPLLAKAEPEPKPTDAKFQPRFSVFDWVIPGARRRKIDRAESNYRLLHEKWQENEKLRIKNSMRILAAHESKVADWQKKKEKFENAQKEQNAAVDDLATRYNSGEPQAIEEYCDLVLSRSEYPDFMPQEFELEYDPSASLLIIEYRLPSLEDIPTLKEVRYVQSRDEFQEIHLKQSELNRIFDSLLYQICLRTIHEIFESDVIGAIQSVVFNGWVEFINKATGKETRSCIMSVQTAREVFVDINLAHIEPKECFRALKGVGSSKLHGMAAVAPVVRMNRNDPRFVESVDVADRLDEGVNLAAIDWQDFEHLIRELFEREFSQGGGEVRVTQASRDGGVDAVAFDPDPIRGGKIVIQAKRYTNAVGVGAVRDLYGTVLNEGASKGILVTTSAYGPDAYEFAKGKPLTLLNGGNLLHLLEKHGHKARIDLVEAKKLSRE